jgi:hypothetical protein
MRQGESDDRPKRHPAEARHLSIQRERRSELSVGLPDGQLNSRRRRLWEEERPGWSLCLRTDQMVLGLSYV